MYSWPIGMRDSLRVDAASQILAICGTIHSTYSIQMCDQHQDGGLLFTKTVEWIRLIIINISMLFYRFVDHRVHNNRK
jgi:hypothetical protein